MMEDKKRNIGFIIFIITIMLLIVIIYGGMLIVNKIGKNERKVEDKKVCENVSLKYYIEWYSLLEQDLELSDDEVKKFSEILSNLEFSDTPLEKTILNKYRIEYCDNVLIVGDDKIVGKDEESFEVTNGYESLRNFLDKKEEELNKVFLYNVDIVAMEDSSRYSDVKLSDEDKNKIREIWNKQEKKIEYIDLGILNKYVLVIDDEVFGIGEDTSYVQYSDGFVALDEEILNILKKYVDESDEQSNKIDFEIHNDLGEYNSKFKERGVYYDTLNTPGAHHYYTVASGEKGSSGYGIEITDVKIDNGNVEVLIKDTKPEEGMSTMSVMTYPVCQLELYSFPKSIVFKTEEGEIFKHLNF